MTQLATTTAVPLLPLGLLIFSLEERALHRLKMVF